MNPIRKPKNTKYIVIIGCGRLGSTLANQLSDEGKYVTVIDENEDAFRRLSPDFGGFTINRDATDIDALKEAQIDIADIVIAASNDDNINVFVAQVAKEIYHVNTVIARLYDPKREEVYKELGIKTICPNVLWMNEFQKEVAI